MSSDDRIEETLALRMLKGVRTRRTPKDQGWQAVGAMNMATPVEPTRPEPVLWMAPAAPELDTAPELEITPVAADAVPALAAASAVPADELGWITLNPPAPIGVGRTPALAGARASMDRGRDILDRALRHERTSSGAKYSRRRMGVKAGTAVAATTAMLFGSAGIAFANAANPTPTTTGSAQVHADGTVTVDMQGMWTWPGQTCAGRYGEGYSVDWWGVSGSPTVSPSFAVTDHQVTSVTGPATTGNSSPVSSIEYNPGGVAPTYFHTSTYYDGQDINSSSTCTDTTSGKTVTSSGPWSASAVYPNVADVPPQLCVIFYDEHGSEGKPSGTNVLTDKDFNPSDRDNSILTNAFNPAAGAGYCLSTSFVPSVTIAKSGPATGLPGGQGVYNMTATNNGNGPASNVVITDNIPTGETFVSASDLLGSCATGPPTVAGYSTAVACTVGTVAANGGTASVQITVGYDATDTTGQQLVDCATATGAATDSCVTTTIQNPDLKIVKSGPATGNPNGTGTYTMTATNSGTADAASSVITDVLPAGESYSSSTNAFGTCTDSGQTVTCPVGTIKAGGGTASVTVTVSYGANTSGQSLQDCATVASGATTSAQACVTTTITTPNLKIVKSGPATGNPNGTGTYTMTATNSGTADAASSVITDVLPAGESYSSSTNAYGTCTDSGQTVTCPVGTIAANGGTASVTVTVSYGSNTSGQSLRDCATVASGATTSAQSCVITVIGSQTIEGHIYTCNAGSPTSTEVPGGNLSAHTGTSTPISSSNPLGPTVAAPDATYTMSATAPTGYEFVTCGQTTATIGNPNTTATESVFVPAGGKGIGKFYVVPTAALAVTVVKTNNAADPGGTTFSQTETAQSPGETFTYQAVITNPTVADEVISSLTDTLPSGSSNTVPVCPNLVGTTLPAGQSVTCTFSGAAPTSLNQTQIDTVTVKVTNVPTNPAGSATGTSTSTVLTTGQSLVGHIYLCANNAATTGEVTGGTIGASGPVAVAPSANPINDSVPAGGYTLTATAPANYTFVTTCPGAPGGTPSATLGSSSTTATEPVTVPSGGSGVGIFYVVPNTPGLGVSVIKTNNAADPNGTDFAKTETAAALGETFTYQAVISNSNTLAEVISGITDTLPGAAASPECASLVGTTLQPGQSVICTFSGTAPTGAGDSVTDTVTVTTSSPPGTPNPGTATGTDTSTVLTTPTVVITKANNAAGTGYGSSETASDTATNVPYQVVVTNNNASPGTITTLTDTVNGTVMNICPDLIGDVLAPGQSATCDFTGPVPTSPTTDTAAVTLSVNGVLVTATAPSTVFPPVLAVAVTQNPPTTPTVLPPAVAPTAVAPAQLAFTGAPVKALLGSALALLFGGLVLLGGLMVTDPRRRRLALVDGGWVTPSWAGRPEPRATGTAGGADLSGQRPGGVAAILRSRFHRTGSASTHPGTEGVGFQGPSGELMNPDASSGDTRYRPDRA